MPVRVLTLLDAYRLGGAETLIAQLARVAPACDIDLEVLSLHGPSEDRSKLAPLLEEAGVTPHYLGVRRTLDVASFARLVRWIKDARVDVVHAHLEMSMTMGVPASRIAGVPVVSTFHHVHRPLTGRASAREKLAVEVATRGAATVFVSEASRVSFVDRYRAGRTSPASWKVVHNGIDTDYFHPWAGPGRAELPADLGLAGRRPVVTVLAALRDFKGIRHAVDAWPAVLSRQPDATLLLVGSGPEETALRAQVAALGVGGSVVFAGMRSDVPAILRASDVAVLPSIYGENLPTVLMEAGACGRPVVASDVGGISDIVADQETGLLVPPGDSVGVGDAILRLLADPAAADQMGLAARARIVELFDAHRWARNLHALYAEVADAPTRVEAHR